MKVRAASAATAVPFEKGGTNVRAASAATAQSLWISSRLKPLLHVAFLLFPVLLNADYQTGLDAYSNGNYRVAMQEWKAVTEQSPAEVNPAIFAEAHYAVARLYWDGQGVSRDYYAAYDWLLKAAELNHSGAMAKLGFLYTDGIAVQQDFEQAFEWYSKAARLGDVDGLYNLGVFYLNGWGTPPDRTMAKQYLAAASAKGDPAAEQALQQLLKEDESERASIAREEPGREQGSLLQAEETSPATEDPVRAASAATKEAPEKTVRAASAATEQAPEKPVRAASAATSPEEETPSRLKPLLHNEDWILAQNPEHYTIQAIGLRDRDKLEGLLNGQESLAPFAIYTVQKSSRPLHVLVQGAYPTVEEARAARDVFPRAINRPSEVWIRQFEKIQTLIREQASDEVR